MQVYRLIGETRRGGVAFMALLVLTGSILDFFSVAFFLPILMFVVSPDIVTTNSIVSSIYHFFGFSTPLSFMLTIVVAVFAFVVLKSIAVIMITRAKTRYSLAIGGEVSSKLVQQYLQLDYLSFQQRDRSYELNKLASYPIVLAGSIILPATILLSEGIVTVLIFSGIALYDYRTFLLVIVAVLPLMLLVVLSRRHAQKIDRSLKEKYPAILRYATMIVDGLPEIKMSSRPRFFEDQLKNVNRSYASTLVHDQTWQSGTTRLIEVVVAFMICVLAGYVVATRQPHEQALLLLGMYAGACFRIIPSVNRILLAIHQIRTHAHILEDLNLGPAITSTPQAPLPIMAISVSARDLSFGYNERGMLLRNASLSIKKGERIAITGNSGEGKTTFLLLLMGFLKPTAGAVACDGQVVHDHTAWGGQIGYVPQSPIMLNLSIAENIAFGCHPESIDHHKVRTLLEDFRLSALVDGLPDGTATVIGEHGVKFSGGQRQRLAIARALYRDPSILLLDEITNQVQPQMERDILEALSAKAAEGKTIIAVTHKANPEYFDSIYRLEDGRFVPEAVTA